MSKTLRYSLVQFDGKSTLTLFHGANPLVANDEHPNWEAILKGVTIDDDPAVADLFDITHSVAEKFRRLGSRVVARDNRIYFDGDEVNNTLTKKIMEFIVAGVDDWKPLVKFMEKVFDNPEEHSQSQLFDWLSQHAFSINEDGDILGYKGVQNNVDHPGSGHPYSSITSGVNQVTVDDVIYTGRVPQSVGSVVEMARSEVAFDPKQGCSAGLHVANYRYASTWTTIHVVLLVAVSPRDVVSVPTESNWEKVRVCRYRVVEIVDPSKERYEDQNPLHREKEEVEEKTEFDFSGIFTPAQARDAWGVTTNVAEPVKTQPGGYSDGERVMLIGNQWIGSQGNVYTDLYELTGLRYGAEGTVVSARPTFSGLDKANVYVKFDDVVGDKKYWVSPDSLDLVDQYDSWEDDGGSWSW